MKCKLILVNLGNNGHYITKEKLKIPKTFKKGHKYE